MTTRWACRGCSEQLGLGWGGRASADGGWCGAGDHNVPKGERIEWRDMPAAADAPRVPDDSEDRRPAYETEAVEHHEQLGLL
jgi:hypothetical protein